MFFPLEGGLLVAPDVAISFDRFLRVRKFQYGTVEWDDLHEVAEWREHIHNASLHYFLLPLLPPPLAGIRAQGLLA